MTTPRGLGTRWIDALVAEGELAGSDHSRGRGLAARGAVHDLVVEPGVVSALVRTRASEPRRVTLGVARLTPEQWDDATAAARSNPAWQAAIIEGRLPNDLLSAFADAGSSVLLDARTTSIECDCERPGSLCSHAAAVVDHVATLLDSDPLLIVTLRNGDRARFVDVITGRPSANTADHQLDEPADTDAFIAAIVSHGSPELLDAAAAWRRKPATLRPEPASRRVPGRPRLAAQPPPAELGVTQRGLDLLAADSIARASAVLAAIDLDDANAARNLSGADTDLEGDVIRLAGAGRLETHEAAAALGIESSLATTVITATARHGASAYDLLARPRRLSDDEVAQVTDATDARIRTRSTGVLFDDGRQLRRASDGTWAVVAAESDGTWVIQQIGPDLIDVLDAADIDVSDPDR